MQKIGTIILKVILISFLALALTRSVQAETIIKAWEFNNYDQENSPDWERDGWEPRNIAVWDVHHNADVGSGSFQIDPSGGDPGIVSPEINLSATNFHTVKTKMSSNCPDGQGRIYFITTSDTTWNEAKSVPFSVNTGSQWQEYSVYMGGNTNWTGTIKQIRIDPAENGLSGTVSDTVGFDYIHLMGSYPNISVSPSPINESLSQGWYMVKTVTINNTGESNLSITNIVTQHDGSTDFLGDPNSTSGTVTSGNSMSFTFNINARNLTPNSYTGRVKIYSNDPDEPIKTININLTVTTLTPQVSVSPSFDQRGTTFNQPGEGFSNVEGAKAILHFKKPDSTEYPTAEENTDGDGAYTHSWISKADSQFGVYEYWAVDNVTQIKSNTVTFVVTPNAPTPYHPKNETVSIQWPTFSWSSTSGQTNFQILIDDENSFSPPYINNIQEVSSANSYTLFSPYNPLSNGTYYWKVCVSAGANPGPWSEICSFNVSISVPVTYYIKGYVKDYGNSGISGVTVNLSGASSKSTTTNSTGYYEFTDLGAGNYTVTPSKTDWTFNPPNKSYNPLNSNQTNQNFIGTPISVSYKVGQGSSYQNLFIEAYNRQENSQCDASGNIINGAGMGYPTSATYWWPDSGTTGVVEQKFTGGNLAAGPDGKVFIIHDQNGGENKAYVIRGAIANFFDVYRQDHWASGSTATYPQIGAPTIDEYIDSVYGPFQKFHGGYITHKGGPEIPYYFYPYTQPALSNGYVTPATGTPSTNFDFYITYTEEDNDAPQFVKVYIDGTAYEMIKSNPSDENYTDGVVYIKENVQLAEGNHSFYFRADDGYHEDSKFPEDGSSINGPTVTSEETPPDTTPPSAVTDLIAVSGTNIGEVDLTWTAPGDDGSSGIATSYDIRYSLSGITEVNWESATQVSGEPTPKIAGSTESFTVTGLFPGSFYCFALKTSDETNVSGISNCPSAIAYKPDVTPQITSISPVSHSAGEFDLTINGTNFDSEAEDKIYYNGNYIGQGVITSRTSTTQIISHQNMGDPGIFIVKVKNTDEQLSNGVELTITEPSPPPNNPPILSWTGETTNYSNDGLNPESGDTNTAFSYRVKYTDIDNDPPASGYPKLHILKNGTEISGNPFSMVEVDLQDTNYRDGKIYTYSKTLSDGTDYTYYFEAYDNGGLKATGEPTNSKEAPNVSEGQVDYKLPYQGGETWQCTQGNNDTPTHSGKLAYAFDFSAGQDKNIVAMRSGTVEIIDDGERTQGSLPWPGNWIVINHGDGTFALYAHLKTGSFKVSKNQWISQGEPIVVVGNSGTTQPPGSGYHVHIQVMKSSDYNSQSIPFSFTDVPDGISTYPNWYKSGNYYATSTPNLTVSQIEFFNDTPPYKADNISIRVRVLNTGETTADNVKVKFYKNSKDPQHLIVEDNLGSIQPYGLFTSKVSQAKDLKSSDFADCTVYVTATAEGQGDANLEDNEASQKVNISYVDWDFGKDAFSFPNWSIDTKDEHEKFTTQLAIFSGLSGKYFPSFINMFIDGVTNKFVEGMKGGHCHGMAAAAILYKKYYSLKPADKPTFEISKEEAMFDIKKYFVSQKGDDISLILKAPKDFWESCEQIGEYLFHFSDKNYKEEYNKIVNYIQEKKEPILLTLEGKNKKTGEIGNHAVIAYGIIDLQGEKRVMVYDSNFVYDPYNKHPNNKMDEVRYASFKVFNDTLKFEYEMRDWIFEKVSVFVPKQVLSDRTNMIIEFFMDCYNSFKNYLKKETMNVLGVMCPVDIIVTDEMGRKTGYINGSSVNEISGAGLERYGDSKLMYYPSNLNCEVTVIGTDTGTFNLGSMIVKAGDSIEIISYEDIPVKTGSKTTMNISPTNSDYTMKLDTDGDGVSDKDTSPDVQQIITEQGETLIAIYKDKGGEVTGDDGKTEVIIPTGILPENAYVKIDQLNVAISSADSSVKPIDGTVREFIITSVATGQPIKNLNGNVTITIPYADEDQDALVDGTDIKEDTLRMFYWDEDNKNWALIRNSQVHNSANSVSADVNQLSKFCLMSYSPPNPDLEDIKVYPNPCYPDKGQKITFANLPPESIIAIQIFTCAGTLVKTLKDGEEITIDIGQKIANWDCKNEDGEVVARGVYVYLIKTNEGKIRKGKIAIIKGE